MTDGKRDTITWLWTYQDRARDRILSAARSISDDERRTPGVIAGGLGSGSIFDVLEHIAGAEHIWLRRWMGDSLREMPSHADFDHLAEAWTRTAKDRREFLQALDEETLAGDLRYRRMADDSAEDLPFWETLLHCSNHTTLHREDACTALTRLGAAPQTVYMIDFMREKQEAGR